MKRTLQLPSILLVLALVGCATTGDPVLVDAQRSIKQAKLTMTTFVDLELAYAPQLAKINPDIHKTAENIRAHGQQWLRDGWAAIEAYRLNKDKTPLDAALAVLDSAVASSNKYINLAKTKGVIK